MTEFLFGSLAMIFVGFISLSLLLKKGKQKFGIVKIRAGCIYSGAFASIMYIVLGILFLFSDILRTMAVIPFMFVLISATSLFTYCNFSIKYDEQGFEYRDLLGRIFKYTYQDITDISDLKHPRGYTIGIKFEIGNKSIDITNGFYLGVDEFTEFVKQKYSQYHSEV